METEINNVRQQDVFTKAYVSKKEYEIHKYVFESGKILTPRIIHYDEDTKVLVLEKLNGMSVSDKYGDVYEKVPKRVQNKVRNNIKALKKMGVIYVDNTGYNAYETPRGVYQLDYGHAKWKGEETEEDMEYLDNYLNGVGGWNPEYK